ncbi:trans-hexaprenyltranstransferase [Saccharomycopsis crataegensis]|uniref:Trans-hexaprenyltranstransferase n=1 Tax=Saccharomycopsis crataegensis TaxID=43959 RepID=A0AAV5QQS8_9ASCO|nr:trans-hexaprenyltranstransferase [Saccharomycopsis crataegensis]
MNRLLQQSVRSSLKLRSVQNLKPLNGYRHSSSSPGFAAAIEVGEKLVEPKKKLDDPISIVSHEMSSLAKNIASLIGSGNPTLNRAAAYYFESDSKKLRPLLVLLLSKALAAIPKEQRNRLKPDHFDTCDQPAYSGVTSSINNVTNGTPDNSLTPLKILHGINPSLILAPLSSPFESLPVEKDINADILPKQRRLAEIVEMIHTASLLHDDVIDHSDTRRGRPSGNVAFTNKMAVLAGDFLLGRASVAIARLRNPEVIELISTSIANLVEGEFMQLKNTIMNRNPDRLDNGKEIPRPTGKVPNPGHEYSVTLPENTTNITHEQNWDAAFQYYLHKTYLKTAALISKSSRSSAVLSGAQEDVLENCYQFGRNLGICFQLVDDILDFTRTSDELGKPAGADLQLGLATGPVLYAWKENPDLGPMIARKFSQKGDIEYAVKNVEKYNGLQKTKELAEEYKNKALENLRTLPESDARAALEFLTNTVTTRTK